MQEHVKLEVALEIIMSKIAQSLFDLNNKKDCKELYRLIDIEEQAYKGDRHAIEKILEDN